MHIKTQEKKGKERNMVVKHKCYHYTMEYIPEKGETIYTICKNAHSLALAKKTGVTTKVLDILIYVTPESDPTKLAIDWDRASQGFILGSVGPYPIPMSKEEVDMERDIHSPLPL